MVKRIGRIEKCLSCNDARKGKHAGDLGGKVTYYLFTEENDPKTPQEWTKREKKLRGTILGACNVCGMCCGETQSE